MLELKERKLTKKQEKIQEVEQAKRFLLEFLKPGSTVNTKVLHVSSSGMSRHIGCYVAKDSEIINIGWHVAKVLDWKYCDDGGVLVSGCGMDMGFHLVYSLSYSLFKDGFDCIGDKCPGNDHFNGVDTKHHKYGGYALRQYWL